MGSRIRKAHGAELREEAESARRRGEDASESRQLKPGPEGLAWWEVVESTVLLIPSQSPPMAP